MGDGFPLGYLCLCLGKSALFRFVVGAVEDRHRFGQGLIHSLLYSTEWVVLHRCRLLVGALLGNDHAGDSTFSPTMPPTMRARQRRRPASCGSPKRIMPRIAVPQAPMPVHTA